MLAAKVKSYAKINLSLNVNGTSGGYHRIDSVVASVDVYDTVCAKPRRDRLVNVYMHGKGSEKIPPERNNAVLAGEKFAAAFGTNGADIEIYKDIPMGAGMGGSSADAAGVLNAMAKLYKVTDRAMLKQLADELGSDTGYMLEGGYARIFGRGEQIEKLSCPRPLFLLMIFPTSGVSTAECYREYDRFPDPLRTESARQSEALRRGDFTEISKNVYNALCAPACRLNGDVALALEQAAALSPAAYTITGSGSAVYALFETEELCRWAKSRYRGKFKTRVVKTLALVQKKTLFRNPFALEEGEGRGK